jgi:hypothetical protein
MTWADTRTIDVLLSRNWSSGVGHRRIAVEVKVSKADYRNETNTKRLPAERAAHQTYYAAPAGIIDPDTLPDGWGLIEVYGDSVSYDAGTGRALGDGQTDGPVWLDDRTRNPDDPARGALCRVRVRPALREPVCALDYVAATALRRASRAEERIRRGEDDAAAVPGLRAEVATLRGQLERRDSAVHREREKSSKAKIHYTAMLGDQECNDCGDPVGLNLGNGYWKHRDVAQEKRCEVARNEADRVRKEAIYSTRYLRGWAGPVVPKSLAEQAADLPVDRYGL